MTSGIGTIGQPPNLLLLEVLIADEEIALSLLAFTVTRDRRAEQTGYDSTHILVRMKVTISWCRMASTAPKRSEMSVGRQSWFSGEVSQ